MGLENTDYIFINDIEIFGKFFLNYAKRTYSNSITVLPVFKVIRQAKGQYRLEAGSKYIDNTFKQHPHLIHHVYINSLEEQYLENQKSISCELKLFSKDHSVSRSIGILLKSSNTGSNVVDIMNLNDIINLLNVYVDCDNDINLIDAQAFHRPAPPKKVKNNELLEQINQLEFDFYTNDSCRVGKDNVFWNELEISNLQSTYWTKLFGSILSKIANYNTVGYAESKIFITYDRDNAYSPVYGRKKADIDYSKVNEIKDLLKLHVITFFDPVIELNERIKII